MIKRIVVTLGVSLGICALCSCHSKAPAAATVNKFNVLPAVEGFVVKLEHGCAVYFGIGNAQDSFLKKQCLCPRWGAGRRQ